MCTSRGQLLDFLHGSFHRLSGYHYCSIYDRQTQKFDFPGVSNLALVSVDFQLEFPFNKFTDTAHYPFRCLRRPDKDIAVSSPGEFHPQALSEPGVNLSAHRGVDLGDGVSLIV